MHGLTNDLGEILRRMLCPHGRLRAGFCLCVARSWAEVNPHRKLDVLFGLAALAFFFVGMCVIIYVY